MATVTSPIITDSTGQDIVDGLTALAGAVRPSAGDIPYDDNNTVKGKIDSKENTLLIEDYSFSATITNSNNAYGTLSVAKAGYSLVGIVGYQAHLDTLQYYFSRLKVVNASQFSYTILTRSTASTTATLSPTITLMYRKN